MAKKKNAEENVAEREAGEPAKTSAERKFPYEVLKGNCMKLFRVTSSTFIGATIGKENGSYSIAEMKHLIGEWLKKEVKK